jgi:lipopolysaccharide transport system ATP-binding protein
LDLGAGFFDDLSGHDNAQMLLGLDGLGAARRATAWRGILEFSGLGRFAQEPVRTYSSGMRVRLAYAMAIAIPCDILVADEVLAVGDEEFQRRCSHHVRDFLAAGGSLVLASHNLYHVEKLCRDAIWLDSGRVRARGPAREVTAAYRAAVEASDLPPSADETEAGNPSRSSTSDPDSASKPRRRFLLRSDGREGARLAEGRPVDLLFDPPAADGSRIEILRPNGVCVASLDVAGRGVHLEALPLLPGRYRVRLVDSTGAPQALGGDSEFDCVGSSRELGTVRLRHSWGDAVKSA